MTRAEKPVAVYFDILRFQSENLHLLESTFDVQRFPNPHETTSEVLVEMVLMFAPLGYMVDAALMDRCPSLRVIASNTTGVPHIDLDAAAERGICVCALHDEKEFLDSITPTAEHTIGLMLAAWRRIPAAHDAACEGAWDRRPWGAPAMLSRLTLGLVGYGRLGKKVADIARAMGMEVIWYDPYVPGGEPKLATLAKKSHILSLHALANRETRGIVSRDTLKALPRGAMVVNTARGELLDEDALLDLLESGHLSCAALDTIEGEYEPDFSEKFKSSRLVAYARSRNNLLLTPHIGGSTVDAWRETERRVIEKAANTLGLVLAE